MVCFGWIGMLPIRPLNPEDKSPLFRQLYEHIRGLIDSGVLPKGGRLPATRELAGQLGLNRTTVSAAYALLESEGLITGHVGRGSFVAGTARAAGDAPASASFSRSRPSELLFPLEEFRKTCAEVIASDEAASILQLGAPAGYPALRRYLLEQARAEGAARESDDILITSGCQQAFDLLQRTIGQGSTVLIEDPVYLGVRSVFERAGARLIGVPVGQRWHRSGKSGENHRARAAATALRNAQFSESDRRYHPVKRAAHLASNRAGRGRHGD